MLLEIELCRTDSRRKRIQECNELVLQTPFRVQEERPRVAKRGAIDRQFQIMRRDTDGATGAGSVKVR